MAVSVAVDGVLTAELADVDGAGLDAALLVEGVVAGEPDDDFDDEHAAETLTTAAVISTVTTRTDRCMNPSQGLRHGDRESYQTRVAQPPHAMKCLSAWST
jgi:hypothetical protein